jgi:DNA-binding transcriptional regulator YdaS (Cro superfamily)
MTKTEAIKHYGRAIDLARALGVTPAAVSTWGEIMPERQALKLERITGGVLRYDPMAYSAQRGVAHDTSAQ